MNYELRRKKIVKKLKREGVDAFLTRHQPNLNYLCPSFMGEGVIVITRYKTFLLVDSRYTEQAKLEIAGESDIEIAEMRKPFLASLQKLFAKADIKSVAIEEEHITYSFFQELKKKFKRLKIHPVKDWVENLRVIKDKEEIENIRCACNIVDGAIEILRKNIKWGITETELANELEYKLKKAGSGTLPFRPIIAGGSRASFPHAPPTKEPLREGEFVIIDCGASYNGYASDLTRTIGKNIMDGEKKRIYNLVLKVQEAAINNIKPDVKTSDLCKLVREKFFEQGVVQFFIHGLGHGVGLQIHEAPALSSHGSVKLKEGMVITIEPGIYIPDKFGVRIEDMVLVTSTGHEVLTSSYKKNYGN